MMEVVLGVVVVGVVAFLVARRAFKEDRPWERKPNALRHANRHYGHTDASEAYIESLHLEQSRRIERR